MFLIFQNQLTMSRELWDILLLHVYTEDDLSETVSTDLMIIIPIRLVFNGPVIQTLIFGLIWLGKKQGLGPEEFLEENTHSLLCA